MMPNWHTLRKNTNKGLTMRILETQFRQRPYDGKWERLAKVPAEEHNYTYVTDNGDKVTLHRNKWIAIGVYDMLGEFV
jgi:hypothetical protein